MPSTFTQTNSRSDSSDAKKALQTCLRKKVSVLTRNIGFHQTRFTRLIRLISEKFGVAKVKISELRVYLISGYPPPRVGGSIWKISEISDFYVKILRNKEKGGKTLCFLTKPRRRRKFFGISGINR